MNELTERIITVVDQVEQLHIVANNNRSNYAPKLAAALLQKFGKTVNGALPT